MLISIVTAVYNRVDTVGAAIDSLRAQSHAPMEHLVQDGGSTDGTLDLLAARAHPAMHVVSAPDGGIYEALNRGIERAQGEVVGLLHSDDVFATPDLLHHVAQAFADPAVDAVYGDLDYVAQDDLGRVIRAWRSEPFRPQLLRRGWMPAHPTLFLRRRVVEAVGPYDTSFRIAADYDYVLRVFKRPDLRAVYLPQVFVSMRLGGASNRSLSQILRKSREDYRALRRNGVGGAGALLRKNLSKLRQFRATR